MMFRRFVWSFVSVFLAVCAGCSEYGGGAVLQPEVSFIAADAAPEADAKAASGDVAAQGSGAPGILQGRVVLSGQAPSLPPSVKAGQEIKDKEVCAAIDLPNEQLVLGDGGGVANAFVFLPRAPKGGLPLEESTDPIIFDQKNCRFIPHCLIAPVGREVRVLSDDPVAHNTHTYPKKQTGVSQTVPPGDRVGDALKFKYSKSEGVPFVVTCDFHGWMSAYHLVLDHPYAAITGSDGTFSIPGLPPGKHTFQVWHEAADGGFVERKLAVDIKSDETTTVQVEYATGILKIK
jgi:hypothetical protein